MADNCAEGKQYLPGWVEGWISVQAPAGERLSAADACRLAGFLMDAADGLDKYNPYPPRQSRHRPGLFGAGL